MRWRVELSKESQKQLSDFPRDVGDRLERAIDEFEEKDESQWSNVKALQGREWKARNYRNIFRKFYDRGVVETLAILIKSKDCVKRATPSLS